MGLLQRVFNFTFGIGVCSVQLFTIFIGIQQISEYVAKIDFRNNFINSIGYISLIYLAFITMLLLFIYGMHFLAKAITNKPFKYLKDKIFGNDLLGGIIIKLIVGIMYLTLFFITLLMVVGITKFTLGFFK